MSNYVLKSHYDNVNSKLSEVEWFFRKEKYEMDSMAYLFKSKPTRSLLEHIISTIADSIEDKMDNRKILTMKFCTSTCILTQRDLEIKVPEYISISFSYSEGQRTPVIGCILDDITIYTAVRTLIDRLQIHITHTNKYGVAGKSEESLVTKDLLGIRAFVE
jgi:hypothetical protein